MRTKILFLRIVNQCSNNVCRHQIWGALDSVKRLFCVQIQRFRKPLSYRCFGDSRNSLKENVSSRKQSGQCKLYFIFISDDCLLELGKDPVIQCSDFENAVHRIQLNSLRI